MNWLIITLIGVFCISFANIYQRLMMKHKESDPLAASIFFQLVFAFFAWIYALIKGFEFPQLSQYWLNIIISALCYAGGTYFLFSAAKIIEASQLTILSALGTVVTIILSVIFLGESLKVIQLLGVVMIISSIIIVEGKIQFKNNRGILYAVIGASFYGFAIVSDTYVLRTYDAVSYTAVMALCPGLVLLLLNPSRIKKFKELLTYKYLLGISIYSFLYTIQAVTYYISLNLVGASKVSSVFRSEVILTVLLAVFILREKDRLVWKILSALLTTIGVLLIK